MSKEFHWLYSGFKTQVEAEEALADVTKWFDRTFGTTGWTVLSSVSQGPYGWKAYLDATETSMDVEEHG